MDFDNALPPSQCEPREWFVVFHRSSKRRIVNLLAWGRFKHVSAFGQIPYTGDWLFFDYLTSRTRVMTVPDDKSTEYLAHYSNLGAIVRMPAPNPDDERMKLKLGLWCVTAVAHLLGLSTCALRPDTLFRHCLANGGVIVVDDDHERAKRRPSTEG